MNSPPDNQQPAAAPIENPAAAGAAPLHAYTFGAFRIDVAARHLIRDAAVVPMTAKVFDTLLVLVKHHDRAVGKEELIHAVWPNSFVSDDSLVQNISAIRRALGDDPSQPQYIATLARRGYRFIAAVDEHNGELAATTAPVRQADPGEPRIRVASAVAFRPTGWWLAAGTFIAGIVLSVVFLQGSRPARTAASSAAAIRFREVLPRGQVLAEGAALSPDGRALVFVASDAAGARQLWMRVLNGDAARPIEGTSGALAPFWSPDSEYIAYFAGSQIKRVSPSGGPARPVARLQRRIPLGGTWTSSDRILFCDQGKIFSVSAAGGTPVVVIEATPKLAGEFRWPRGLPDGRHFLFVVNSDNVTQSGTYLGAFGSHEAVRVLNTGESPAIHVAGYLLYVREHVLMAQQFDVARGVNGEPRPLLADLSDGLDISATSGGLLAVSEYTFGARAAWLDRSGKELSTFKVPSLFRNIAISPDNTQALATSADGGSLALWKIDLNRNVSTRLVTNAGFPAWAPDGNRFAFIAVGTGGAADLSVRSTTGSNGAVWLKTDDIKVVTDWSTDGRFILFNNNSHNNETRGVWVLPTFGDHTPKALVQAQGTTAAGAHFSPDQRAIAYVSDETGTQEVYVTPFPGLGVKQQVSTGGGAQPAWRPDSRELFYFSADRQVMAVAMPGDHVAPAKPQALFAAPNSAGPFGVTRDGRRFLLIVRDHSGDRGAITMLTNWMAAQ